MPVAVLVTVFSTHVGSPVITPFDSLWTIPTARSIIRHGDTNLDEHRKRIAALGLYQIDLVRGHYYSLFPIGCSILAIPVVAPLDLAQVRLTDGQVEKLVASIVVALTAMLLYLVARRSLATAPALAITFVFAFCTAAWSTASRALWPHGPSMLMLALALWLLVRAERTPSMARFASLPLAFSYVVRPTNAVSIAVLTLFVSLRHPRHFVRYLLWSLPVAVPFVVFDLVVYGAIVPWYYSPGRIGHTSTYGEALAGNLVSPGRGLFVFSPILLLAVWGAWLALRRRDGLGLCALVIVVLHWATVSSFPHWWAGHSYGNRYLSDVLPLLVYLMVPAVSALPGLPPGRRASIGIGCALLALASLAIHARGATTLRVYEWNRVPVDIDVAPARLWDWRDPQFLRGLAPARPGEARPEPGSR
jgi:hypothetical protein